MMYGSGKMLNWSAIGDKVKGISHITKEIPCQDAFKISKGDSYLAVSVADGHGSAKCKYSDEGSEIAVETANSYFAEIFVNWQPDQAYLYLQKNFETKIPRDLELTWKEKVLERHRQEGRDQPEGEELYKLYGTTLLSLVITDSLFLALQLGDGDILMVSKSGDTTWFIEPDNQLGSETFSLSSKNAWKNMKGKLVPVVDDSRLPKLFILSTDGYSNSFISDGDFLKIGHDYLKLLRNQGSEFVKNNLPEWLSSASQSGSGDDIALVLLYNHTAIEEDDADLSP